MIASESLSDLTPLYMAKAIAKPFETCSLKAYWDPVGFPTNGWGNLLSRVTKRQLMEELKFSSLEADKWLQDTWPEITQDEADLKLSMNLLTAFNSAKRCVKVDIGFEQLAALTDFAFNLGAGNLQSSTLLKMINRGEYLSAADQFMRWNKAGGTVLRGLTLRRKVEKELFLLGL